MEVFMVVLAEAIGVSSRQCGLSGRAVVEILDGGPPDKVRVKIALKSVADVFELNGKVAILTATGAVVTIGGGDAEELKKCIEEVKSLHGEDVVPLAFLEATARLERLCERVILVDEFEFEIEVSHTDGNGNGDVVDEWTWRDAGGGKVIIDRKVTLEPQLLSVSGSLGELGKYLTGEEPEKG